MAPSDTLHFDAYLDRIRYEGMCDVSFETLAALHTAHLAAVPFENLDVLLTKPA